MYQSRIGEIQTHTDPCQWKHVPGDHNVADDATRGISVKDLNGRWMNGPEFLFLPEENWPEAIAVADEAEVSKECRKVQAVFQLQNIAVMLQQAINCKRFSKWRRLVRVTAWMIRFFDNLKAKVITGRAESQSNVRVTRSRTIVDKGCSEGDSRKSTEWRIKNVKPLQG